MPDTDKTVTAESAIFDTIHKLLEPRGASDIQVTPDARLTADLGLGSLELAELSAVLEHELQRSLLRGHRP